MQPINADWQPKNQITTPLSGIPSYTNSGIIKALMGSGEKISVAQIDYQEFDEENFQYVISPYWEIIDGLPSDVFQGIPGIDMDLRLKHYYRANYTPVFITERTPSKNREDLWDLLASVGLDYYDRFEWLLRTQMRAANDNLIVERRRMTQAVQDFSPEVFSQLQYGDKIVVESLDALADTSTGFSNRIFTAVTGGIDIINKNGRQLLNSTARSGMISVEITKRMLQQRENAASRQKGIERAKQKGKYAGRKPIKIDENILCQVAKELDNGSISVKDAMRRTGLTSRSTFYRKLKTVR